MVRGGKPVTVTATITGRDEAVTGDNSQLWPGFVAAPLTEAVRKELKLDDKVQGVAVTGVTPKSAAAAIRLQNNDIVTAVNDKKVTTVQEFYAALDRNGKKEIWFDVYSDGHPITTSRYKLP
jgi:S1-C subfamily serine protease